MTALLLLLALVLIATNGFFVGAEFAVLAARRPRLEPLAARSRRARTALRAIEQLPLMISACQFGITLASLGLGALGEPVVAKLLRGPFEAVGLSEELVHPISLAIALTVVSALHMLLGEMVPKNLALAGPERAALLLTPPLLAFVRLFRPIITSLTALATAVLRLLKITPASEVSEAANRDAVAALIAESGSHGLLRADQQALLSAALAYEEKTADSVKIPLESLIAVAPDVTPAEVERLVASTGYSRFPIAAANTTGAEFLGYIHLADVLETDTTSRQQPIDPRWIRPLGDVAAKAALHTVLATLKGSGSHLARVVDEHGQTRGVLALENVLEQLVGEVSHRHRPSASI